MDKGLNPISQVLLKIWVFPFFIRMAGFLFLVFYFLFGFTPAGTTISFHALLIFSCLTDIRFFFLIGIIWILYYLRIFFLVRKFMKKPQNEFLLSLIPVIPKTEILKSVRFCVLWMACPLWLYGFFMEIVAIQHHLWISGAIVLIFHISIILFLTRILSNIEWIGYPFSFQNSLDRWFSFSIPKYIPLLAINFLLLKQRNMIWIGKLISLILLAIGIFINRQFGYDYKVPYLFWIICLAIQFNIVYEMAQFDSQDLEFMRNIPFNIFRIYGYKILEIILFIIPEIILLMLYPVHPFSFLTSLLFILLGIGNLLAYYSLVYLPKVFVDRSLSPVFFIFILLFLLNLYSFWVPMVLITWLFFSLIFFWRYYEFEWKSLEDTGEEE